MRIIPLSSRRGAGRGQSEAMQDASDVQCPYCFEWQQLDLDPDTWGSFVQDCDVCCRPWHVTVSWQDGEPLVHVERAQ